jgi:hypothetical protein
MHKLSVLQSVVLERDLDEPCVSRGAQGVVLEMLEPDGVAVEFFDKQGWTCDIALIPAACLRPAAAQEIAESRILTERVNDAEAGE